MNNCKVVFLNIFLLSVVVVCFEIISTRISSVIFVQNYAFMILSLSILGLGSGGIFSYYMIKSERKLNEISRTFSLSIFISGISLVSFIVLIVIFSITNPYLYFSLLFIPFFLSGIVYSEFFRNYANNGFRIYASDLIGAASGSLMSIYIFNLFNAVNIVLFLSLVLFGSSLSFLIIGKRKKNLLYVSLLCMGFVIIVFGKNELFGKIPIGYFPEKDYHHVYDDPNIESTIIDSRWSINGRSDLVEYSHQSIVKHLFIDGAAGTQMYQFNGNIEKRDDILHGLLMHNPTTIPFLFLNNEQKESLLIIGPGGGKEILSALLSGVKNITGVEVNPDFVDIVKKYKNFNGGIFTDFQNIRIEVAEGRHFLRSSKQLYNIILLALPSTEQLQIIDGIASNENFLLTVEALKDYMKILTQNGQLIFTVHNKWELVRLIVTALYAFEENDIENSNAVNHFMILGNEYSPTVVIKKSAYTPNEINSISKIAGTLHPDLPKVTYLPNSNISFENQIENILLKKIKEEQIPLEELIEKNSSDISPVRDDSPYFYKIKKGVPEDYKNLLVVILTVSVLSVLLPLMRMKSKSKKYRKEKKKQEILLPLFVFTSIGIGFMILEISLLQKFILYLGTPTIALSILLGSLLVGMGIGSYFGEKIYRNDIIKRLIRISGFIVITGLLLFILYPLILDKLLMFGVVLRAIVCFILLLPFGFLLGIPFPTGIQLLKQNNLSKYIPWMYGVNGIFSVLGSVTAVIMSMLLGFTASFFTGISIYFIVFIFLFFYARHTGISAKKI